MAALAEALGTPLAGTDEAEVPSCPGLDVMFFAVPIVPTHGGSMFNVQSQISTGNGARI